MKPQISYCRLQGYFWKDGVEITDEEARAIWDSGTGDWSQVAYEEMSRRAMQQARRNNN